jgi:hypothetical protein
VIEFFDGTGYLQDIAVRDDQFGVEPETLQARERADNASQRD